MFQFGGSWSFVWGDKPTKTHPLATRLEETLLWVFLIESCALAKYVSQMRDLKLFVMVPPQGQ